MNVDQNSSKESCNSKPNRKNSQTNSTPESGPSNDAPSTSRARDPDVPEAQRNSAATSSSFLRHQSQTTLSQSDSAGSTNNWIRGLFSIFSRGTFKYTGRSVNEYRPDSSYSVKLNSTEESNAPFKLISRISIRTTHEQTSLRQNDQPATDPEKSPQNVDQAETVAEPSLIAPILEPPPITEQPRSQHTTNQIYVSPVPIRESISNTQLIALGRSILQEPEPNIPPSYSTVIKFPPPEQRRTFGQIYSDSNLSFFNRVPPPSYAQVQGAWVESVSEVSSEDLLYGPLPQYAECPRCTVIVITETRCTISKLTHFTAVGLCLLGCWPCCLLPYFMESCKDTYHYCPICHHCFGLYSPWVESLKGTRRPYFAVGKTLKGNIV